MVSTRRIFRFDRKALRAAWYLAPWLRLMLMACAPSLVFLMGLQWSAIAWLVCFGLLAIGIWRWRRESTLEAAGWGQKQRIQVWFEDGKLLASDSAGCDLVQSLSDVVSVDATEEKGRILRLVAIRSNGERDVYSGYADMDAFAAEFRRNAVHADFRRMRFGFPMTLREVDSA